MSCARARETDLAAFRADPGSAEFREFASHYPTCADCAEEVAAWSALEAALRAAGGGDAHPSEARLLAFASPDAGALDPAARVGVERHLAGCAQCRSEVAVLRDFDPGALGASSAPQGVSPFGRLRDALAGLAEAIFGVPQPALALAAILALGVPAAWFSWQLVRTAADAPTPPIAQQQPQPRTSPPAPPAPSPPTMPAPPVEIIAEAPAPPAPEPDPVPERTPEPAPEVVAVVEPPSPVAPEPDPEPETAPVRIAALLPETPPDYRPDPGLSGGSLETIPIASVLRSGAPSLPKIRALGPAHLGATHIAQPTLYWQLEADTDVPVELTLIAEEAAQPLLELRVEDPRAGIHALHLADHGVRLAPGTPYLFFASLVPDERRRDDDVVSGAGVVYAPADAGLEAALAAAPPERRAHVLAEAGYWIDAFATVSEWLADEPDAARLRAYHDALLAQAGVDR